MDAIKEQSEKERRGGVPEEFTFSTVEDAISDLKNGKIILVTDDEDRENEGDFICAAEFATTESLW